MTLEDFEKTLAEEKREERSKLRHRNRSRYGGHHHKHRHHEEDRDGHRHKRRRHDRHSYEVYEKHRVSNNDAMERKETQTSRKDSPSQQPDSPKKVLSRDSWMQEPTSLDIDFTQRGAKSDQNPPKSHSTKADFDLKIHENELNKHHLQILADGKDIDGLNSDEPHDVDYAFGDAGALWRMTKLRAVYNKAKEAGRSLEDAAVEQYGSLQSFDEAREEQIELDRRETYGDGYVGKSKPSGDLFAEREIALGVTRKRLEENTDAGEKKAQPKIAVGEGSAYSKAPMDQSALNRLKAQMMKAKLKGGAEAAQLEEEYNAAVAAFAIQKPPDVVVLGAMDNRILSSSRKGEVKSVDTKRGRERGLVETNDDMTVEDMVREERRTKGQNGGEGRNFAERIAKDAKFDNDLEYMDENAVKLSKRVQRSEINLRNIAISDFQKINRILDNCPLCHHEESNKPPLAPIVSLATRVYLTLPTTPEISDGGACIVPIQHRDNLLFCDDDEWEEVRNFMKSLTRMYHDQGRDVIFYENAAAPQRKKHAALEVVPLPYSMGNTSPAFFKEAILAADDEWTQHKKLIDTLAKARDGFGKAAFRRTLAKEVPYFHVWFEIDGGLGHVVEDANRWPRGDLFAREVIGGMLDKGPEIIRKQGRWVSSKDPRVEDFRRRWKKFDWTRILHDG